MYAKPNSKYIESLLTLYDVQDRKCKQVPEHTTCGQVDATEDLNPERQACFRRGLGIAMYLAQDRVDIQFCVKTLASSMKTPTLQAEKGLIQLILYLSGTRDYAFKMPYTPPGTKLISKLNNIPEMESTDIHVMEAFCDSDWGGGPQRRSTTSVAIFLNSLLVLSYSRTEKSTALSSCEAEVLAMTSGASEAVLLQSVWQFMVGEECELNIRSDSSSGRQWLQRSGLGRLKHYDVRLCWLQDVLRKKLVTISPVGTKLNVSDVNTKRLSAARRKFLLYFFGLVKLNNENQVVENVGEVEYMDHLAEESLRQQVLRIQSVMKILQKDGTVGYVATGMQFARLSSGGTTTVRAICLDIVHWCFDFVVECVVHSLAFIGPSCENGETRNTSCGCTH